MEKTMMGKVDVTDEVASITLELLRVKAELAQTKKELGQTKEELAQISRSACAINNKLGHLSQELIVTENYSSKAIRAAIERVFEPLHEARANLLRNVEKNGCQCTICTVTR